MREPLITVITCAYNGAVYLEDYFTSFTATELENLVQLIIVNDASTDDTLKILKQKQKEYKFLLINNEDQKGLSMSRNYGLKQAIGEYIFFLDIDDWLQKNAFLYMQELIYSLNDVDIFIFEDTKVDTFKQTEVLKKEGYFGKYIHYVSHGQIGVCVKLFKRWIFEQIHFSEGMYYEDLYFQAELAKLFNLKIYKTNTLLYYYRNTEDSITNSMFSQKKYKDYIRCFECFRENTSRLIYEFAVIRAGRHLLAQAHNADEEYTFYQQMFAQYCHEYDIEKTSAMFAIWKADHTLAMKEKDAIFSVLEKYDDHCLTSYIKANNIYLQQTRADNEKLVKENTNLQIQNTNLQKRLDERFLDRMKRLVKRILKRK